MHIVMHVNDVDLAEAFTSYVERRLRFALGRFGERVGQITVRIGADGPGERQCRISTELLPFGRVVVEETDPDLFVAIDRATGRTANLYR
jgi:putative sigma-54 modulation protein